MRAALVGGGAYAIGKRRQAGKDEAAAQEAPPQEAAPPPAPVAAAPDPASVEEDKFAQLKQLKGLLDDGVLTQEEFDAEKAKLLSS